jgi:rubrerythrin
LNALKRISSTGDNLLGAAGGEHHEFSEMYPDFIKQAEAEGEEKGQPAELKPIVVCHYCGNTIEGEAPENAPFAGHQRVCSG